MLPCSFYTKNSIIKGFNCPFENINKILKINPNKKTEVNRYCEFCLDCAKNTKIPYKKLVDKNTIINNFGKNRIELIRYKNEFKVTEESCNLEGQKNARKFIEIDNILVPKSDDIRIDCLKDTIFQSSKRAQDNYYGYAICNKWQYFLTLTFSNYLTNRYDDNEVKECWGKFKDLLTQSVDKNVKILAVPERHKDNALHFHCLMTLSYNLPIVDYDINLEKFSTYTDKGDFTYIPKTKEKYFLLPYYIKGVWQKSKTGSPLYCLNFYHYGISTLAILPEEENQVAVINYLITYTTKEGNIGYNKKRYYRTYNLNFKDKLVCSMDYQEIAAVTKKYDYKLYKENDKFIIYRNFNIKE